MRTGCCKYGANCKFNHPDPTTVAVPESLSGYNNGVLLQGGASQSQITSWTSPRVLNETPTFVPAMISPSQDSEWNAYQVSYYVHLGWSGLKDIGIVLTLSVVCSC